MIGRLFSWFSGLAFIRHSPLCTRLMRKSVQFAPFWLAPFLSVEAERFGIGLIGGKQPEIEWRLKRIWRRQVSHSVFPCRTAREWPNSSDSRRSACRVFFQAWYVCRLGMPIHSQLIESVAYNLLKPKNSFHNIRYRACLLLLFRGYRCAAKPKSCI